MRHNGILRTLTVAHTPEQGYISAAMPLYSSLQFIMIIMSERLCEKEFLGNPYLTIQTGSLYSSLQSVVSIIWRYRSIWAQNLILLIESDLWCK